MTVAAAQPAANAARWQVVWQDEFTGPAGAAPDAKSWQYDLGHGYPGGPAGWGNHELQEYTADPSNVSLDGHGALRITPTLRDGVWRSARIGIGLALLPALWMLAQALPIPGLEHPVWASARLALGGSLLGSISIDTTIING